MAHHADAGPHDPKRATPRHILREIRHRVKTRVLYEHDRAKHASQHLPKPPKGKQKKKSPWSVFHGHWIATGIAGIRKAGLCLNLLTAAPPSPPVAPNTTHVRVVSALLPAQGKRPPAASWALLVEDVAADGSRKERMRASGAIATTATHAGSAACIAARQTRQVAHQAAATKGLRSVAQHSTRQGNLVLTIHNPTTERDLRPLKQGEYRHSTSHRHLAVANAEMLQALQRRPGVTVTLRVDAGGARCGADPSGPVRPAARECPRRCSQFII